MTQPELSAEEREKELTARLKAMELQMERLSARLGEEVSVASGSAVPADENNYPPEDLSDVSEELLNWASRNALLPRLATLCFLMVVALILRTITDSGVIDKLIGSGIGMGYATILMFAG